MQHIVFALLILWPELVAGQAREVPGRDLLFFPLGLTAEAPPLGGQTGTGLWNPASVILPEGARWRVSAASMNASPDEIGVSAQVGALAAVWRHTTFGLTFAHAAVADLLRTDSDPQSIGSEIAYSTTLVSGVVARRFSRHLIAGIALRSRSGQIDNVSRSSFSGDVGIVAEHLTGRDIRLGVSTFLLPWFTAAGERSSYLIGADARVVGSDSSRTVRAGYAATDTPRLSVEHYLFAAAKWDRWELRGGPVRTEIYGARNVRMRLGVSVHHHGYAVGIAREESANGLAPTYHFAITSVIR